MRITNTRIYGLEESIIASRYPKMTETPNEEDFPELVDGIIWNTRVEEFDFEDDEIIGYINRAKNLGKAKQGSGHDCFLKGIIVQADYTANQAFWLQHGRYDYSDIVSSQSKMHCITKMDLNKQCNKWVTEENIEHMKELMEAFNEYEEYKEDITAMLMRDGSKADFTKENLFQVIINNCPTGLNLTARITDNYLSLKTQYNQRKNHSLEEWQDWKKWVEQLPYFKELTGIDIKGE